MSHFLYNANLNTKTSGDSEINGGIDNNNNIKKGLSQQTKDNISVYLVEDDIVGVHINDDPAIISRQLGKEEEFSFDWILNEVESSILKIIHHMEETL